VAHLLAEREQQRALALGRADGRERGTTFARDPRDVRERLGVVDRRRLAEQALLARERRLLARLRRLALDRLERGGLFAGDVGRRAAVDFDRERACPR
jgi:hypothetical protein